MAVQPLPLPRLKILSYSSFAGVYGPGPVLKKQFEKTCKCEVQWFLAEDSTALLQRFLMVKTIDMVIGWDQITKRTANEDLWENISGLNDKILEPPYSDKKIKPSERIQKIVHSLKSDVFIPFDWSPIGFIYKDKAYQVLNLKDLPLTKGKISLPEPRTSNLGLLFYYWIYESFKGDKKKIAVFLEALKDKIYGPVFSWSQSYGFFRKGQSQLSLSYLSSLLYHQKEEPEESYFFAEFPKHPYHIEFFSISKKSKNKALALKFAQLLLSETGQKLLMKHNYMFPISYASPFKKPQPLEHNRLEDFLKHKKQLLDLWEKHLYP